MDCIFCKIVEGTIPSTKVFEDDRVCAFLDIQPSAPEHVLIIPKKHIPSVNGLEGEDFSLIGDIHRAAQTIAKERGVADSGYRLITNTGPDSGQVVFHLHYHLLGGEKLGPLNA
ncbi:histidine triad (HIT) family protein [Paenibacillus sp. UNCCL117]|uniref:histidine triad nucleotide-binding protein n=1 Tax=unclassified Paenibacillus TaxID=185978 RepID=UPI00088EA2CA|nr:MULTISPECIES: histidine triad nucleotide-binding protein [unclassified Paenibacillus]SDC72160.1 histidine triad (HIT) family protein [Paenibacillus sp. cl123]SFW24689.1 histidine triad (HIT) family protein [Paenibacillus sp. UNCCL117]